MRAKLEAMRDDSANADSVRKRCAAILMAATNMTTSEIAGQVGTSSSQVSIWRRRFADHGLDGLIRQPASRRAPRREQRPRDAQPAQAREGAAEDTGPRPRSRQRGPVASVKLEEAQRQELLQWAKAPLIENRLAQRARVVLQADEGYTTPEISDRIMLSSVQVLHWCRRFNKEGVPGLRDRPRSGRPKRPIDDDVARVLALLDEAPPEGKKRWTGSLLALRLELPDHHVRKILRQHKVDLRRRRRARRT